MKKLLFGLLISLVSVPYASAEWKSIFTQMGNKNVWAGVEVFDENNIAMVGVIDKMGNSQPVLGYSSDGNSVSMGQPPQNPDAQISVFFNISGAGTNACMAGMSLLKGFPPPIIIDVARSTNRGKSFTILKDALKNSKDMGASSIYFSDPMTGWIVGGGNDKFYIAKSTDGGNTWEETLDFFPYKENTTISKVFFINDRIGWIVGGDIGDKDEQGNYIRTPSKGFLLVSTDGGKTFKEIYSNDSIALNGVHFIDCQNGLITGYDRDRAYVFYTNDGGKTLHPSGDIKIPYGKDSVVPHFVSAIQLLNPNDGFLAANYITSPDGSSCMPAVFKTSDGGKTWTIDDTYANGLSGFAKYACIYDMKFYSERVGYLVGQHLLVAKYTNENASSENHRCVECMLGKCHQQESPDAGVTDTISPDITYPDGQIPDISEDTGPVITCPSDKILPVLDSKVCIEGIGDSSYKEFKPNVGFAELVNGTSFVGYIMGSKEGMTLAQARDAANNKTEDVTYIKISISPAMKVSELYGYSGIKFTASNISAQISYNDSEQILKIRDLEGDVLDTNGGKIKINTDLAVLTPKQLSSVSTNLIDEICNLNPRPCGTAITDAGVITEDGEIVPSGDTTPAIDVKVEDGSYEKTSSDGCSCTTLF
jgi:photosystem II stability/assembly factor-like uncharacterized protein